jgi:hypothetical protein
LGYPTVIPKDPELLLVLERPEVPLHTNDSERDIRDYVKKRCDLRSEELVKLGNAAGQQELPELNKWNGEYPSHRGYAKPTKPATLGMNSQG